MDQNSVLTALDSALDPRPKIREYFDQLARTGGLPSPLHLLVWTRELIEFEQWQDRYPTANLYGNWAVHTILHQSAAGRRMLVRLNGLLGEFLAGRAAFSAAMVAQELHLAELRAELKALYAEINVAVPFLDSYISWRNLLLGFFDNIRGKPIRYGKGFDPTKWDSKGERDWTQMRAKLAANNHAGPYVVGCYITIWSDPATSPDLTRGSMHWVLLLWKDPQTVSTMMSEIHESDFEPPSAFKVHGTTG